MAYRIINGIFAALILLVFIYSAVFPAGKNNYPVPSFYELTTGKVSPSSGLSRSFSEMVRLDFSSARKYNVNGPLVFSFFFIQLLLRGMVALILRRGWLRSDWLIKMDVTASVLLFMICFRPFLAFWEWFPPASG